jgi:hypothetical protein
LSKEEAQLAKELAHQRKSNIAAETRSETNRLQEEALQRSIERTKEKLYIIEQVQIGREHKRKVQQKILDDRREQAADMDRESEERWQQRERELAEERARKAELIKQIRAMEQAALANIHLMKETKQLDLTETSGISLLTEMSIVELQERLRLMKIREAEEEQEKRERIQTIKQQQQMFINEKLRLVEEYHRESQAKEQLKRELHAYKDDQSRALSILSVSTKCSTVRSLLNGETSEFDKMKRIQAKLDKVRMQRRRLEQEKSQLGRAGHPADFTEEPEKEKAKQFADEMFSYVDNAF